MDLTTVVAVYAAVVATGSLVVAVLAFRAGSPRIEARTALRPTADGGIRLTLTVTNKSRAAATVQSLALNLPGPHTINLSPRRMPIDGPELPVVVPAHTQQVWAVPVKELREIVAREGWPPKVRAVVGTGDGSQTWESIHEYTNLLGG
jgi:hypothetical protein